VLRMNALAALGDFNAFVRPIKNAPLTESRVMGKFTLADIERAAAGGEGDSDVPKQSQIDAAFMDTELPNLEKKRDDAALVLSQFEAILALTSEKAGAVNSPDYDMVIALLKELLQVLNAQVKRCGGEVDTVDGEVEGTEVVGGTAAAIPSAPGGINSRKDVDQTIDAICDYFDRYDPSSPVPFILKRAKRLLFKDFKEILHDLAPDGITQAENIFGQETDGKK